MAVYARPEWETVDVLELDMRKSDFEVLIEFEDGSTDRRSIGQVTADGALPEIEREAGRIVR